MSNFYNFVFNPFTRKNDMVLKETLIRIKESVDTYNDLPVTGNTRNDTRYTLDTNKLYTWTSDNPSGSLSDWLEIGAITLHSSSHQNGGADELDVTGLSGVLANNQNTDWSLVANKPSSSVANIDDAVTKKHIQNTDTILTIDGAIALINAGVLKNNLSVDTSITIDGRDISVDGAKLDTIEDNSVALTTVKSDADIVDVINKKHSQNTDTQLDSGVIDIDASDIITFNSTFTTFNSTTNTVTLKGITALTDTNFKIEPYGTNSDANAVLYIGTPSPFSHPKIIMNNWGFANRIFLRSDNVDRFLIASDSTDFLLYNYGQSESSLIHKYATGNWQFNTTDLVIDKSNSKITMLNTFIDIDKANNNITIQGDSNAHTGLYIRPNNGSYSPFADRAELYIGSTTHSAHAKIFIEANGGYAGRLYWKESGIERFQAVAGSTYWMLYNHNVGESIKVDYSTNNIYFGANKLFVDYSNSRIGINNTTPKTTLHSTGSTIVGADSSEVVDGDLNANEVNVWVDETSGAQKLKFKVKLSDNTIKSGEITLS